MSDTNDEKKTDWQEREMGALWKKDSGNQKYLTGHVKTKDGMEKVIIFSNKHKTKDNQPDFRVYRSEDREQQEVVSSQEEDTL